MLHRRIIRRSFMVGAAAAALAARPIDVRGQARPEKARLLVAVGVQSALQNLPLTLADRLGFFAAEGLDIEMLDLANAQRAQQAVMEGAADVACCAFEALLDIAARKHLLQAFVLLGRAPQIAFGLSTRSVPAIGKVAELRGRQIAIAAPGSSAQLVAALVLAREGLSLRDVQLLLASGIGVALQMLRSGQALAVVHTEPVISMLEQKGDIRVVADTRSLKGAQDLFGGTMPGACLIASSRSVQNHANALQAMANAVVHALKWLQTAGPSDLIKAVPEPYMLGDRGLYLAAFSKLRESIAPDGLIPDEGARTAMRVMERTSPALLAGKVEIERVYTNDFARKAKDKFRA